MKILILFLVLVSIPVVGFSQKYMINGEVKEINVEEYKKKGYIVKDSVVHQGYIDIGLKDDNTKYCLFRKFVKDEVHVYSPDEIEEWGVYEECLYRTFLVEIIPGKKENAFLKVLSEGKVSFLCFERAIGDIYFLKDSLDNLIRLKSTDKLALQEDVQNYLPDLTKQQIRLISTNQKRLKSVFDKYNSESGKSILISKFGVTGGIGFSNFNPRFEAPGIWTWADIGTQVTPEIGVFVEWPLFRNFEKLTFQPQLIYSRFQYSYNTSFVAVIGETSYSVDETLDIDVKLFKLPLIFRYNTLYPKIAPFLDAGLLFSYNVNDITDIEIGGPISPLIRNESEKFDKVLGGACIGGGTKFNLDYRRTIYIAAHYEWSIGISDRQRPIFSNFVIKTGISF